MPDPIDGWNVIPLACAPTNPPPDAPKSTAASRWRLAHFGKSITADQLAQFTGTPLKET